MSAKRRRNQPALSLELLRRRILEEMERPDRWTGLVKIRTQSDLARQIGVNPSHMSRFLRGKMAIKDGRGISWRAVDRMADLFGLEIWELFVPRRTAQQRFRLVRSDEQMQDQKRQARHD